MSDLRSISAHLKSLGEQPPTPERRAEVQAALSNKFEGVQAVAARVLRRWGGRESVEALRAWLAGCLGREASWGVRGVAVQALADLIGPEDAPWALDLYFGAGGQLLKHELLPLVLALPPEAARDRLVAGLRDRAWEDRQAAVKAIGNMAFPDRDRLLSPLRDDAHPLVRSSARLLARRS